jgi:dipeptidyl aminopeptidase/acylaminoacyl peptidase
VWSPDGGRIAFVSNHTDDPDKNENNDIFIIEAKAGAQPRQLTTWQGNDKEPQWNPDGRGIAYMRSAEETYSIYDQSVLCIQEINEKTPRLLSKALDRPVTNHRWSKDGKSLGVLIADDCVDYMATYDVATGVLTKRFGGDRSFSTLEPLPGGEWVAGLSEPHLPTEIFALNKKG